MRDNIWLEKRLDIIWKVLIPEIEKKNKITIIFKGKWKNKFAHIKRQKDSSTEIAINAFFRYKEVPDFILDTTIAHELVHYMHGFHSPYEKQFKYPHQGGIVNKELKKRGFNFLLVLEKEWIKNKWESIYKNIKQTSYTSYNSYNNTQPSHS
ncbi:MAG: hypothetical protein ABIH25_03580 [Candidatus Woesearchaeota archaeon]